MTTNPTSLASRLGDSDPGVPGSSAFASGMKLPESLGKERLKALLCELDEGDNCWTEQIAAMIEEDYRQLMKDFGLR